MANLARAALAGIITILLQGPMAVAVPTAEWGGKWDVVFPTSFPDRFGMASAAFGQQATSDGQITDRGLDFESLPGTPAWAKSGAFADAASTDPDTSLGIARVLFERTFRLQDSPTGWNLDLSGELEGEISGSNRALATVEIFAEIFSRSRPDDPLPEPKLNFRQSLPSGGAVLNVMQSFFDSNLSVDDGIYTVKGGLTTVAIIGGGGIGSADSNFFSRTSTSGFRLSVFANPVPPPVPVPETTPLLLFGTTVAGLVVAARWRERKHS